MTTSKDMAEAERRVMDVGGSLHEHLDAIEEERKAASNGHDSSAASPPSTIREAALFYAERGFLVFPAPVGEKKSHKSAEHSNGKRWGATDDADQIDKDFTQWPNANIGLPTGSETGFFVVEADTPEGHDVDGIASLNTLQEKHGQFPATRIARSPSGSLHYYFKYPEDVKIKNSTSAIAEGVDVRGEGGMVIAPPSVKPGRGRYEWISWTDIAEAPDWLIDLCKNERKRDDKSRKPRALLAEDQDELVKALAAIPNNDMNWEDWNTIAMAAFAATGGSEAGFAAFDKWSQKSKKYDGDQTRERWEHLFSSPPTDVGAGTIYHLADQTAPGWRGVAPTFSEEDIALRFSQRHGDELRFVAKWGQWYRYDGQRWKPDDSRKTFSLARAICREVASKINKPSAAKAIASAKTRMAVVSLASDDRRHAATVDQWDADPWLLNTPGGVIDLRSGERREALPEDYMTKITSVAPDANCPTPLWSAFLDKVTNEDKKLQRFLARISGYGLTGSTREHALFFFFGTGRNGKGVFMNVQKGILGDYHCTAPIETFTESSSDRHPTELAMLRGARLVASTETEKGRRWAESRIKNLTGGDPIRARFMRQDFFEYVPQFKLMIAGNHKPGLRSVDEAIRSRVNIIPFTVTVPPEERDKDLGDKLVVEYPGILQWMIDGCMDWQKNGLARPKVVADATDEYLKAEDAMQMWIETCCATDPNYWTPVGVLFERWKVWAEAAGETIGSMRNFSQNLETAGFERKPRNNERGFIGLTVFKTPEKLPSPYIWDRFPM